HEAVAFVGPARCGKTEGLITGWMAHAVVNDPGDMAIIHMSQEKAREFSKTTVDRALRHSPDLAALVSRNANADNTFDKSFRHGMWLKIGWPTVSNLSGSTYRYVAFTDYDRMPDDVGGEGAPFPLGLKRTQTFLSRGMCLVESSPGRDIEDPNWKPSTPHEAPAWLSPAPGATSKTRTGNRLPRTRPRRCAEWLASTTPATGAGGTGSATTAASGLKPRPVLVCSTYPRTTSCWRRCAAPTWTSSPSTTPRSCVPTVGRCTAPTRRRL
ncbi:phage terminase large subunit family protein, partial [Pseudoalteromonas sp. NZS127]|nr:phage terminase large subunit family protein [Pseudoalteromonas sp. NZS127]